MNDFFKGKKLLVVGGTSGMGLETARQFLKAGGSVVLTGSKQDKADAVRAELSPLGNVSVIVANLMTEEGMNHVRSEINANHSDIGFMVNSAGIFIPKPFIEHDEADYDMYLDLNRATFFITRQWSKICLLPSAKAPLSTSVRLARKLRWPALQQPLIRWLRRACTQSLETWQLNWLTQVSESMPFRLASFTPRSMKASWTRKRSRMR